jgi:hypothetical protein
VASEIAHLKRRMKFGPKMSREMGAAFLSVQINGTPRRLSAGTLQKLKAELERIAQSTKPAVRRFVLQMFARYPEIRP